MQFCDDCGSMMKAQGDCMVCTNEDCAASSERDPDAEAAFVTTESQTDDDVIESDENANFEGKPKATDVRCEACGNEEAWYTLKQTASADEPPTRFFKCTECGKRWRGYN
ncbi:RPA12/RPB9/RPC11 RNA polymerase family protein [Natrialbaceae archaeon AArc-T1-2]|uniref:RPA12/RPB9/RPC11 RNA polymerase family protein n=1 Tax=Natrialbaceae archaeon AArc-T1-2 TaxID=3053904 RepID=UPI00255AF54C|nr:RPA12/RPB9/RPC11 RNA polymerase family protein [Natrialbaceae archaeon AArc-T1-2]WIV67671.1 RPA12/RPB9/RPC11 RNA polymerase family protein [Natrialbaceae archaeon AArc-T1-2]